MSEAAKGQHKVLGFDESNTNGLQYNPHPDAQWFKNGGNLGLFIHFGISTVNEEVDLSWGMKCNKPWEEKIGCNYYITPNQYFALADSFYPEKFEEETDKMFKAFKEIGGNYAVFTTRHHDGYAMWPSKSGNFNITMYHPELDLVEIFVRLCRKYGFKVGLYYSPPDWHLTRFNQNFNYHKSPWLGLDHEELDKEPVMTPEVSHMLKEHINTQIRELLTQYGKVDILWFDGAIEDPEGELISYQEIRDLQPHILFPPRLFPYGDFKTFEVRMADEKPDGPWEHCNIWAEGPWWAHMKQQKTYQSAEWFVKKWEDVKAWDGNFLINVGPRADGSLPPVVFERLEEVKALLG